MTILNKTETLANLPPAWPVSLLPQIQAQVRSSGRKIVVLDDDPTGTQTVYDIPVLTEWPVEVLAQELLTDSPAFYLLTNSRSMPLSQAQAMNTDIGRNLLAAAQQTGHDFVVVSRSDSTLRGHFPGEVEALAEALGRHFDAWLIIPFFLEGGRYTINDIHYVAEGESLVPAGETPFA
ncbi:MAG TPA: four-carbon acid sugar kinase family protein, partial [Anaerolineae bacterium]|nr:four-carbon acid sugar kinase family protein [Anaerolineae bacterium]